MVVGNDEDVALDSRQEVRQLASYRLHEIAARSATEIRFDAIRLECRAERGTLRDQCRAADQLREILAL